MTWIHHRPPACPGIRRSRAPARWQRRSSLEWPQKSKSARWPRLSNATESPALWSTPPKRRERLCGPSSRWEPRSITIPRARSKSSVSPRTSSGPDEYQPLRPRLYQMDREMQVREMRQLSASPDWVVGSVHALTEDGSLLVASASGSQLGPIASGAGHVILVVGTQKIVPDFNAGLRRVYEYCFPLEDRRARQAYGVPSGVNNVLIINKAIAPGRITAILVNEALGF